MQTLIHAWLALVIDISIKSLLLAAIAGLGLFLFRIRDTNLRHRVWTAVLFGMLVMPALVYVIPSIPLPDWMTVAMLNGREEPVAREQQAVGRPVAITPVTATDAGQPPHVTGFPASEFPNSAIDRRQPLPPDEPQRLTQTNVPQTSAVAPSKSAAAPAKPTRRAADRFPFILASLYSAVAAMLIVRLLVGLALARRLIAQAREIGWPRLVPLPRRRLRLLESGQVHVPATLGFLRPVLLLPSDWRNWTESKLRAVLAHELAHVRRADWLVITLADLNRAIYWFHPLAWFLRRRLSELAERNCDDAVLEAEEDRTQYARHLLEVAGSLATAGSRYRQPVSGVAMARKPNVETRIEAILDAGRPLARRLSAIGLAALVTCGTIAILTTAAMRTSAEAPSQKPADEMKMKAEGTPQPAKRDQAADSKQAAAAPNQQHIKGRVLGPNGKPVAGATVYVAWTLTRLGLSEKAEDKTVAKTTTDARGSFVLTISLDNPDPKRTTYGWKIVAFADGLGPAWQRDVQVVKDGSTDSTVSLALTNDLPVRGRIVDLEGTPLENIHVRINALRAAPSEKAIGDWIQDAKTKPPPRRFEDFSSYAGGSMASRPSRFAGPFPSAWNDGLLAHGSPALPRDVVTDRDGRFEFNQLGANRLAILEVEGQNIAKSRIQAVVREMETVSAEPRNEIGIRASTYFGREFQFVAEPMQAIVGTVKDATTNEPLVNYQVNVELVAGNVFGQFDFLTAQTDDHGHYRIDGAPRGGGHTIQINPTTDQPYFPTEKTIKTESGREPITCDFAIQRGRWITGKVTDRESKSPITGAMVEYLPLRGNPHAKDFPNYDPNIIGHSPSGRFRTAADGSFHVLAIPGKGILGGIAMNQDQHTYMSLDRDSVPKDLVQANGDLATYHPWTITGYHALKQIEIPASDKTAKYDLEFTGGSSCKVQVVDTEGHSVVGVRVLGRVFPPNFEKPTTDSTVEIIGLRPNEEREVIFIHPGRKIGRAIKVAAGKQATVELEPCAVARGRIVNEDRQPFSGLPVKVDIVRPDNWSRELLGTTTGEDGRFEVLLPPGATYDVSVYIPNRISVIAECCSTPGAIFELGDLANETKLKADQTEKMVKRSAEKAIGQAAAPRPQEPAGEKSKSANQRTFHGRIIGTDGKPVDGADVAVIARRNSIGRGGDLDSRATVLGETKADADGGYEIKLSGVSSKTHQDANLIARASGLALAWRRLNLDADDVEASFDLKPEQAISGRLVDIEGQPAAGVRFQVASAMPRVSASNLEEPAEGVGYSEWYSRDPHLPAAWPQVVESDRDGRFVIHGIPKDHGVFLQVQGDDRFAPQSLMLNTGMSEQRGERDATYRSQVTKNLKPGEEAVLPLAPAQIFTGTVRYEDTGEPAPHARLTIWASQQKFGSMISIGGKADEKGHYKITPLPGIRFGVAAYPPNDAPYLVRQIEPISWEGGERTKTVDVILPRGVLVRGKVLEEGTDSPVVGASVQYAPEEANNPNKSDKILTGWQDIHLSDRDGRFQIAVLPGPGRLLVHGPTNEFVVRETSERELDRGKPGWRRDYVHGIERIEPSAKSPPLEVTIRLKRSATVHGELVDEQGAPVDEVQMLSQLEVHAYDLNWRGSSVEARGGRFELSGLANDRDYPVHFLQAKRRLGATTTVRAGMAPPRVVLEPCGGAKMRFVDDKGKPVGKFEPIVQLVMTPGELQYSEAAMKSNALTADAVWLGNYDLVNHPSFEKADDDGRFTAAALIPGATYQVITFHKGRNSLSKEFQAVAKETIDLGDIVVERKE